MMGRVLAGTSAMAFTAVALVPTVAHAEGYRFWSYWTGGQSWTYSQRGPGFLTPADGAVEGWHFVVSAQDGSSAQPPAAASSYEQLCPGQPPAPEGRKRIAVVVDFGPAGIAPTGETPPADSVSCVVAPIRATGLQILQQVTRLRFHSSGLICAISGYPAKECPGTAAGVVTPSKTPTPRATRSPVPTRAPAVPALPQQEAAPASPPRPRVEPTTPAASTPPPIPTDQPSAVALALPEGPADDPVDPPAWVAAIGATMIAVLLGVAVLLRRRS